MDVKVEPQPKSSVKLTVTVSPKEMSGYFDQAAKALAGQVNISGFRKGRAPRTVLENRLGKEYVAAQALDLAITQSYYEAVTQHKLKPIARPQTDIPKELHHLERDGLTYTAVVAVAPDVKLPDYKTIKVKPVPSAFSEKLVEETLQQIRKGRAKLKSVDRSVKAGDRVEIDFVGTLKDKEIEGAKSENHPLVIGEDSFVPGFSDQLVGMKTGQVKEFDLKFPKEYHDEKLAKQKVHFTVTLKQAQEIELPELTDAFAKAFGAKSVADLKKRLTENLKQEKEIEARRATEAEVVNKVAEKTTAEIPEILVDEELGRMVGEMKLQLERQGVEFEKYLEHLKKTEDEVRESQRDEATRRVKISLVLNAVQKAEQLKPGPKEIKAEIDKELAQAPDDQTRERVKSDDFRHYVTHVLGNRQAVQRLVELTTG